MPTLTEKIEIIRKWAMQRMIGRDVRPSQLDRDQDAAAKAVFEKDFKTVGRLYAKYFEGRT